MVYSSARRLFIASVNSADLLMSNAVPRSLLKTILPCPDDPLWERRQKFSEGLRFRAIVSGVFALVFFCVVELTYLPDLHLPALFGLLALLVSVNGLYWLVGVRAGFPLRHFYFHWLLDLVLISVLLYLLGGIDVPYGFLAYVMIVVTSATFLSKRSSFVVASGATVTTIVFSVAQMYQLIHPPHVWGMEMAGGMRIASVTFSITFYYVFAYLAGTLADQLKYANADLARARNQIEAYNKLLEAKVTERTRELERRNAEIEGFVHIVTHDLKNVSIGATETARRLLTSEGGGLRDRAKRYVEHLLEDTRRMNEMLAQLLGLFRVDHQQAVDRKIDIGDLAREIVRAEGVRMESKGVRITVGDLPIVIASETPLKHVLTNLIDNAIKYVGDKPDPEIEIACQQSETEWVISVADNGIGISGTQRERIFQLYHRGPDQAVAGTVQQGEGVGLAMSKRLVERWGGRIWVESRPKVGSRFYFSVPKHPGLPIEPTSRV
jgi:signal transduction histidine kinase